MKSANSTKNKTVAQPYKGGMVKNPNSNNLSEAVETIVVDDGMENQMSK
jgi:hypothetical protein